MDRRARKTYTEYDLKHNAHSDLKRRFSDDTITDEDFLETRYVKPAVVAKLEREGRFNDAEQYALAEAKAGYPSALKELIDYRTTNRAQGRLRLWSKPYQLPPIQPDSKWGQIDRYGLEADGSVSAPWRWTDICLS